MTERPRRVLPLILAAAALALPGLPTCLPAEEAGEPKLPGAYRAEEVTRGGNLSGRVMVEDPPPPHGDHAVTRDQETCGRAVPDERLLVGPAGELRNAVVSLQGIRAGKPVDTLRRPRLLNAGCRFEPHVLSMSVGQKLEIVNGDPLLHNAHAKMDGVKTVFSISLPVQNQKIPKLITEPGAMKVECDAGHTWMSAWVVAFPHPYHAVTDEGGSFRMEEIPPGRYRVRAWHEELGSQELEVSVPAGGTARVEFRDLSRQPGRILPGGGPHRP